MMSPVRIVRWSDESRLADILNVVHASFRGLEPPSGVLKETLSDVTARFGRETFLVALADREIVGSVFCARKDDAWYLTRMAVRPDWQRQGIGAALVAKARDEARRDGASRLMLRVRQNLPGNRDYFAKLGFAVCGAGQDPGRPPYDVMQGPPFT